jgi:hypothetical protein
MKTFFNPAIKGTNYSPGQAGYVEMLGDLGATLTTLLELQAAIKADPLRPAWPATSTAPDSLKAIPVRAAILLLGLVSGISTQSKSYDASSGPAGNETTFGVVLSPALAVLENGAEAATLAILANYDMEVRAGGVVYDNSKTNFSARLGDDAQVYAAALSGATATTGMIGYLQFLAPKVTANPAAVAKLNSMYQLQGKIEVPTITLAAASDHITPGGAVTYLNNQYAAAISAGTAKANMLLNVWNKPADSYSTFDAVGAVTPDKFPNGVGHCNYTASQVLAVAKLAAGAAKTGKLPSMTTAKAAIKNDANLFIDPNFEPPMLKFRQ